MVKPHLYIFGWPSFLGGADTKLHHLILLLWRHCEITVVPNEARHLKNRIWTSFLREHGVAFTLFEQLPPHLSGYALALSNQMFFTKRIAHRAKERGLKVIWSSEMMWHHEGELEAVAEGVVDMVLYVSAIQRAKLEPGYGRTPGLMTGNYIDPDLFPYTERRNEVFTIGRLSRAAPEKYPDDFPVFYEALGLPEVQFRVMAWDEVLASRYRWHRFDDRWQLLATEAEPQVRFLQSLDLFVYTLGHRFKESWGRSTVEAMLTGAIPLVPTGHQFESFIDTGKTGFICSDFSDYAAASHKLFFDYRFRSEMARETRRHAVACLCNKDEHLRIWRSLFQ